MGAGNSQDDTGILGVGHIEDGGSVGQVYTKLGPGYNEAGWADSAASAIGGASWGAITGTLSNQTDLQSEIDTKADLNHEHDQYQPITTWLDFLDGGANLVGGVWTLPAVRGNYGLSGVNGGLLQDTTTINLPPAASVNVDDEFFISNVQPNSPSITVYPNAGDTIGGQASIVVNLPSGSGNGSVLRLKVLNSTLQGLGVHWGTVVNNSGSYTNLDSTAFSGNTLSSSDVDSQTAFETLDTAFVTLNSTVASISPLDSSLVVDHFDTSATHSVLIDAGLDNYLDGEMGFIKDTSGNLWSAGFKASEEVGFVPLKSGTNEVWDWSDAQQIAVSNLPNDPQGTTFNGSGGPIYDLGDGTGMIILHLEGNSYQFLAAGKVVMDANGPASVTYLGPLIEPEKNQTDAISDGFTSNAGAGPFLTSDDGNYIHIFYQEWVTGGASDDALYSMARVAISEIETDIAANTAPDAFKWTGGNTWASTAATTGTPGGGSTEAGTSHGNDSPRGNGGIIQLRDERWVCVTPNGPSPGIYQLVAITSEDEGRSWTAWNDGILYSQDNGNELYTTSVYSGNPASPNVMTYPGAWIYVTQSTIGSRWSTNEITQGEFRHWSTGPILHNRYQLDLSRTVRATTRASVSYSVLSTDEVIFANSDAASVTVSLPAGTIGRTLRVINSGSSGNQVAVSPNGSEHLYGVNSDLILYDAESAEITYDDTDGWY